MEVDIVHFMNVNENFGRALKNDDVSCRMEDDTAGVSSKLSISDWIQGPRSTTPRHCRQSPTATHLPPFEGIERKNSFLMMISLHLQASISPLTDRVH